MQAEIAETQDPVNQIASEIVLQWASRLANKQELEPIPLPVRQKDIPELCELIRERAVDLSIRLRGHSQEKFGDEQLQSATQGKGRYHARNRRFPVSAYLNVRADQTIERDIPILVRKIIRKGIDVDDLPLRELDRELADCYLDVREEIRFRVREVSENLLDAVSKQTKDLFARRSRPVSIREYRNSLTKTIESDYDEIRELLFRRGICNKGREAVEAIFGKLGTIKRLFLLFYKP